MRHEFPKQPQILTFFNVPLKTQGVALGYRDAASFRLKSTVYKKLEHRGVD